MAPRSNVQLIDKRQDVMSRQIVWKCCKRVHWGVNQRLENALREVSELPLTYQSPHW